MIKDYHYHKNKTRRKRQFYAPTTIDKVIRNVIEVTNSNATIEDIKGQCRDRELTEIRLPVYWILTYVYDMPVTYIGKNMHKHHSTVSHGRDRMEDWYCTDKDFRNRFDNVILKKFEEYRDRI